MADKQSREELSIKVNVDVSEALTGLKAIQREAREAAKALRELEEAQKSATVYDLQAQAVKDELSRRRGDRGARDAVLLIEEQAQMIGELKRKLVDKSITDDIRRSYE